MRALTLELAPFPLDVMGLADTFRCLALPITRNWCYFVACFPLNVIYGVSMKKRHKMSRTASRRKFSRSSDRTHRMNLNPRPMRGGTRL